MKKILLSFAMITVVAFSFGGQKGAKGGSKTRPTYSGSKHSDSHGGTYVGGHGSSHKGGHYTNPKTDNQYGKHKKN